MATKEPPSLGWSLEDVETRDDHQGFDEFFRREYPGLVRQMTTYAESRVEGEELAQEAMVRVLERWDKVSAMDQPHMYLFRVALNLRSSWVRSLLARISSAPPRETTLPDDPDVLELRTALRKLSKQARQCVFLADICGFTTAEVAEILGVQPPAARARLSRARKRLRAALEAGEEETIR